MPMSLARFVRNAVADFKTTAAIVPSSQRLVRAMVEPLRGTAPEVVVEFGPGTGVMTRELLRLMPPHGLLLALEISPRFVTYLCETIRDERLHVVQAGAETAASELRRRGIDHVDGVVSSLGIGMMDNALADTIFRPLLPCLHAGSTVTQFQYMQRIRMHHGRLEYFDAGSLLECYFSSVRLSRVWLNIPPAFVITCRGARNGAAESDRGVEFESIGYTRS